MDENELQKWLKDMGDGDESAFEYIYEVTSKDVYRTIAFFICNKHDIEELVNEVYVQMWKSLHTFDNTRSFRFWLHGIVVRKVKDWRRQSWRRFRVFEKKKTFIQEQDYDVAVETVQHELQSELIEILKTLSHKHREVIILRYFHDHSIGEIAQLLQIPIGTVKSRLHNALKFLRKDIESLPMGKVGNINGF